MTVNVCLYIAYIQKTTRPIMIKFSSYSRGYQENVDISLNPVRNKVLYPIFYMRIVHLERISSPRRGIPTPLCP